VAAACVTTPDLHTADPVHGYTAPETVTPQQQAQHICLHHCPVLAQCQQYSEQVRAVLVVQAGMWWPMWHTKQPRLLAEVGHGHWCAHLAVRRR
jgi:hypothetical protein